WNAGGANPVDLAYHWIDAAGNAVVWDGARTKLQADGPPAPVQQLTAPITAPPAPGTYILQLALVKEGVAWLNPSQPFGVQATPAFNASHGGHTSPPVGCARTPPFNPSFGAPALPPLLLNAATYTVTVPVTNTGISAWSMAGP